MENRDRRRKDMSATVLRKKARREKAGKVASRMFGIANILDGMDRGEAARLVGTTRQSLRDWGLRYNEKSIEGLRDRPNGHAKRALTPEQEKSQHPQCIHDQISPNGPLPAF